MTAWLTKNLWIWVKKFYFSRGEISSPHYPDYYPAKKVRFLKILLFFINFHSLGVRVDFLNDARTSYQASLHRIWVGTSPGVDVLPVLPSFYPDDDVLKTTFQIWAGASPGMYDVECISTNTSLTTRSAPTITLLSMTATLQLSRSLEGAKYSLDILK